MKLLKWIVAIIILIVMIFSFYLSGINKFQRDGEIKLSCLSAPVKVIRDKKGMPYIYAENFADAVKAQGFITAQDRLFQMELTKLFSQGRLSELAGYKTFNLDKKMRTLGFHRMAKKHAKILNASARKFYQNYADGINEYIKTRRESHHFEFKLAGIKPGLWAVEDILSILYYMGWGSAANLKSEIVALMLIEKLGFKKAKEIFPININPDDPSDNLTIRSNRGMPDSLSLLKISNDKKLMTMLRQNDAYGIGSNNWVVSSKLSQNNKPILANDPHLDPRMLPGPWYPSAIIIPGHRAVGVTIPGIPGMIIGRNNNIAFGVTNSYSDAQDLYIETIDPDNSNNYLEGNKSIPFETVIERIKIKDKEERSGFAFKNITVKLTKRGPVISGIIPGLNTKKVITVRWSPYETMSGSTGIEDAIKSNSIKELKNALSRLTVVMLNFVFADKKGNIGWHTTGKIPIRTQRDSIVPFEVKNSKDNWIGWIPFDKMPGSYNPAKGWVGTCNHKTVSGEYPYYISSFFSPPYRYSRLKELLSSKQKFSLNDHWKFQRDTKNLLAEKIAPIMAKALLSFKDTEKLGEMLSKWNYMDNKENPEPLIFQSVYIKFAFNTFKDEMGDGLAKSMLNVWYFWQSRLEQMILQGNSAWFDDTTTREKETIAYIFHRSASEALREFGSNPEKWEWGQKHQLEFVNPIMRKGFLKSLLGGGSHPMSGSGETLYRGIYNFKNPFYAEITASLRMVADMADDDKVLAVLPGGVCGRLFDAHNTDQIEPFMKGDKLYWWFSDRMINQNKEYLLKLVPQ